MTARPFGRAVALLGDAGARRGLDPGAYDTAWLAAVADPEAPERPLFAAALGWIRAHQHPDGSWGGELRYEHDRILCTLAALAALSGPLRSPDDQARVTAATRYLWQRAHLLAAEPVELVGFELILPALAERAARAGIAVPPNLDPYGPQREAKLRLIPPEAIYTTRTTAVHSLEFLGERADVEGLRRAQGPDGGIGCSPAATAFFFAKTGDPRARAYLEACLATSGGAAAPVLWPSETFELLWAAYHLFLAGVPAAALLTQAERAALGAALDAGGVSLSPSTFPIPDADDTAVALLLLHELGVSVDARALAPFASASGHFVSFPHERHSSVGVNIHVLHALARVPGYPERGAAVERLLGYLRGEQRGGGYWIDKWHISPYYATSHAVCVLVELSGRAPAELMLRAAREWIRRTQNEDGSWGFYGVATAEETAHAALALAAGPEPEPEDRRRCAAALGYLERSREVREPDHARAFPPLWIDKCLYTPRFVVRAVIEAARVAAARVSAPA